MKRENKNTTLNIRTVQAVRDMVNRLAAQDQRSVASTIERLIRAEFERTSFENQDDANAHHGHARR